ncbi:Response regulator receiver domain-containing protein [Algoriphagus locisalis]|uniref:Response regulator receiver domain-containing protein n=1 Tax=Algoriphagus locisalis TaxID=305507 RepID=A0A1I6XCP3_9BACT|nr:response regulator [Algoriphagus locisalis]SFT35891.1 Response regulator receiver domain-containing protein [Algoriphagus locisalis]
MKGNPPIVYIIDDDQVVLLLHKIQVKKQQLFENIQAFFDAREALENITSLDDKEQRILIFLDINMPKMNGWEFLTMLQQQNILADIKVVVVTSSLSKSDREKSAEFNLVIDFWEKPMVPDQLIKLREQLGDWLLGS